MRPGFQISKWYQVPHSFFMSTYLYLYFFFQILGIMLTSKRTDLGFSHLTCTPSRLHTISPARHLASTPSFGPDSHQVHHFLVQQLTLVLVLICTSFDLSSIVIICLGFVFGFDLRRVQPLFWAYELVLTKLQMNNIRNIIYMLKCNVFMQYRERPVFNPTIFLI